MLGSLRKWTIAGVAAATLAGTVAASTQPAQAFYGRGYGYGFHHFYGGGFGYRPFGPRFGFYRPYGFYQPFYRHAYFGPRFYGPRFYGYGPGFYRHRFFGPFGYHRFGYLGPRRFFY